MFTPSPEEQGLIMNAKASDLDAFNQLVLFHQDIEYAHALNLLGDPDEAADASQESFIKAFRSLNGFRCGSFRAWLLRIVANTILDTYRRAGRHISKPLYPEMDRMEIESPAWIVDPSASVEETVQQNEDAAQLYRLLDELPAAYRSVILLVDVYEMDYIEAARTLHIPTGTVKSRLARARLQIREKLKRSMNVQFLNGTRTLYQKGNAYSA